MSICSDRYHGDAVYSSVVEMAEISLEVQDMDYSQNGEGAICIETDQMYLQGDKNEDNFSHEVEHSDSCEQAALVQMDYEDHVDLTTSDNTFNEVENSSASLEHPSLKSVNEVESLNERKIFDEERSKDKFEPMQQSEEKQRQVDQRAFQEIRSLSGKENDNVKVASEEKEQKISQLEAELLDMRQLVERVHRERLEAEKARENSERRVLEIQGDLEAAESTLKDVKADNEAKHKMCEKHQLNLNEAVEKLGMQSRFLESGSVEANRAKESIELERSCQDLKQKLAERDGSLKNLRECQEQLRLSFKRKEQILQQEKDEIITALEASELKSEEQKVKLREHENDLTRFKGQAANFEKRCATAEAKATESSSLLGELRSKLDSTTMELFELKNSNGQLDIMRMRLQECERALSHATSQKALAESSLRDLKLREEHIELVEQGNKGLEERLKWRNEQFQSLEEAHSKIRLQFKEKSSEWDAERAGLLSEIDSLQGTLESKERLLQELQNQLQMIHQALSHEESRRKVLELQAAESRQGLEQVTAGYEAAQSAIETLREQTSTEIGTLRNTLGAKDRQLKDLQVKHLHMEQEYTELKDMEKEYRAWQSSHGEEQKQFLAMKERMTSVAEAHESLRSRMKEQEKNFEKERGDLVKALDLTSDTLTSKNEALKQLDCELERVKEALEHVKGHRSGLESQLKECTDQLEGAFEEAATARQALTSLETSSHAERSLLEDSLHGKDKVIQDLKGRISVMDQSIAELSMHEEKWLQMRRDYEELQQQQIQRDVEMKELEKIHTSLLLRVSQEEEAWTADRDKLVTELQFIQEKADGAEMQLKEVQFKYEMHRDVILKLEARCASHEKEIAEHCLLADQAGEQLALERIEMEKVTKEACALNESLSAALSHKDLTVQKLKDQIVELEEELQKKDEETLSQSDRVSLLEKNLKENSEVQCNMQEHIAAMKSQACKAAEELKMFEDIKANLEEELRKSREAQVETKTDLEGQLEVVHRDWSASCTQLKAATQRLQEESAQKEHLLKDLDLKESTLTDLLQVKRDLLAEKESLEHAVYVLETKKIGLLQEVESSKTTINELCNKYEAAQLNFASTCDEVKDLQAKLQNAHKVSVQLLEAEAQNRDLEGYLHAAKAIAQDKEEKLAASEWAVQQLALDVGKAKTALNQKDREEGLLRYELADVERQLNAKEGALIEMECYLDEALMARESMQGEVDKLCQRMEDLDRGAADWKRKELDMTTQLHVIGAALEEKREALVACELEVKRGNDLREVMDGAIESLKLQLADEQRALSAQQNDMNRLCEDLEKSKGEANSSAELVKELQGRLQQLEQSSDDRMKQFHSTLSELKDELSLAHVQLENYQNSTRLLTEESSRYKEKCEALLNLNLRKDFSLKEMETQLVRVQASALDQSKMLEQRDQDLQRAKEQHQYQDEKQTSLQESLSRIQSQRSELQIDNEELRVKLMKLTAQLDSLSTESVLKSEEIENLNIQLEQMRGIAAQEGETQMLMTKLAEDLQLSSKALQEHEVRLCTVQNSLDDAQRELQVLQADLAVKDSDTEMLLQKLSTAERQREDTQAELSKVQDALQLAQNTLTEKSGVISSQLCMMNAMEVETAEWKGKAECSSKEASSLTQELHFATNGVMESQKKVSEMQKSLEGQQFEVKELTEKLLVYGVSTEELQSDLKEWKEKMKAAAEENLVLKAALEKAEVMALEKDTAIGNLRKALENAEGEVSKYNLLVNTLQGEISAFRVKEIASSEEGRNLVQQLKVAQEKAEVNQLRISELQDVLEKSGYELKEKTEQTSYYISLFSNLQEEVVEWKSKIAAAESEVVSLKVQLEDAEGKGLQHHQEIVQITEAMMRKDNALIEERRNVQYLRTVEHDLIEERMKVAESASLIADLEAKVEGLKSKAGDAANEGEIVKQELKCAVSTVSSLTLQLEEHRDREQSLEELNSRLQIDLYAAQEEALARREKMESVLHQLEQSQDSEKELLDSLQMEHKRLIMDLENDGGFDCTFETDASEKLQTQDISKTLNDRVGEIHENLLLEEPLTPSEACALARVNMLEKELDILRLRVEESQHEAHQLAGKLDAALSNVATKNLIIKQVNDEIMGLRSLVKRLEQETLSLQDNIHGGGKEIPTESSILESETETVQQNTGLGKRKAESQEELNHYLDLCDSLVRKNIRLEKQLDGVQRKNRGLQKQVEGLQMTVKSDKERRVLDPVDCSSEQIHRGLSRKSNPNVVKPANQDRRMVALQDVCKGKVLGEIDENVVPVSLERSQISRRPLVSPAAAFQQKKARRVKDEM